MRNGKYVVDSIENSLVKLLYSKNEEIEEVINISRFTHEIKQGDVVDIQFADNQMKSTILEDKTKQRREHSKRLMEKLINKNK
jgi:ribosomal 50S subunit-recycling heat shock protein